MPQLTGLRALQLERPPDLPVLLRPVSSYRVLQLQQVMDALHKIRMSGRTAYDDLIIMGKIKDTRPKR